MTIRSPIAKTYATLPFAITSGSGMYVFSSTGRKYLDLYGGHAVAILGHSPKEIAQAIAEQAQTLLFYSNVAPMPLRDQAADRLLAFAGGYFSSVFFCNSGGEANENALKIAITKTGRERIIALKGGWHGRTLLAASATDDPVWSASLGGWIGPVTHIAPGDEADLHKVDDTCAAVIVEPIQSMAGVVEIAPDYLIALRKRCDEVGALLIYDEVQTGMGRLGVPFAAGFLDVVPDMLTSAKGIAAGIPCGAVLLSEGITEKITVGDLGSTFGGGPIAMAALLATIEVIERDALMEKAQTFGEYAKGALSNMVKGRGALLGVVVDDECKRVQKLLIEKGIIVGVSSDPSVIRLLPPLIAEPSHVDAVKEALA